MHIIRLFALLAAVVLIASACSSDPTTTAEEATAQETDDTHDMDGMDDYQDEGGQTDGHDMDGHSEEDMDQHMAGDHDHDDILYPPHDGAEEIVLSAVDLAFEPDRLTLSAGEPVNLRLVNDGQLFHDLTLDEPALHVNVDPGEEALTGLVIDEPGTYEAVCTVPGHEEAGMVLVIEVE